MSEKKLHTLISRALGIEDPSLMMPIHGVTSTSNHCANGFLFVAVKGATALSRDGHDFIEAAVEKGAHAAIVDAQYQSKKDFGIPLIRVADTRRALSFLAEAFYDYPSQKLHVIGITGTNGKTSTTFMLHSILRHAGFSPKIMG